MTFTDDQLSRDDFLDGQLHIWQPLSGYRAATDPVFLAASVAAKPGATVLELGCGVGTALLCLAARIDGLKLSGAEIQADYAALAARNAAENNVTLSITQTNISDMPLSIRDRIFDEVITNPPFYDENATPAGDEGRDTAKRLHEVPLEDWLEIGLRRTAPLGHFTLIHRAERLADILAVLHGRVGDIRIKPLTSRIGRDAGRVIIRARKGARGPLKLLPPMILHQGEKHEIDGDDFTPEAREILRKGKPLIL